MIRRGRAPALVVIAALLVAGGIADRAGRSPAPVDGARSFAMPMAAKGSAVQSSWYCAGATAVPSGPADGAVVVANPGRRAVAGTVTFVPVDLRARSARVPFTVPAASRAVLRHQDHVQAPFAAAVVEVRGGGVAVEHTVTGPLGADVAPCASSASSRWYFADGGTTRDAVDALALLNPFGDDAIVDLAFSTDQGRAEPQALQGVVVPGRRLVVVNVGEHVRRRRAVSVTVAARGGRLVADRIQTYDGSESRKGVALVLGTPSPGRLWHFPEGVTADGLIERYQVYNPAAREARVLLEPVLDRGSAEPFELTVPAEGRVTLRVNDEARIPKLVGHSVTVRSDNGVGVVVERSVDGAKPSPRLGLASTVGARGAFRRWVLAAGLATPKLDEEIAVQNPGTRAARVRVVGFGGGRRVPLAGLGPFTVGAGRRRTFRVGRYVPQADLAIEVTATEPVAVERGLYRNGTIGISSVVGIPLP